MKGDPIWEATQMMLRYPYFLRKMWEATGNDRLDPLCWIDIDIARWLQHNIEQQVDCALLAYRGFGKTSKFTQTLPLWMGLRDPENRTAIISKTKPFTQSLLKGCRQWLDVVPFLNDLIPDASGRHRDRVSEFDFGPAKVTKDPSVAARGIESQLTGMHGSMLVCDDIETKENTKTISAREWIRLQTSEFRRITEPYDGTVIVIGTVHHEETIYEDLQRRGYEIRSYPVEVPSDIHVCGWEAPRVMRAKHHHEERLGRSLKESDHIPLHPGMSVDQVRRRLRDGRSEFAKQEMQCPRLGGDLKYPLRLTDLIVPPFEFDPHTAPVACQWGMESGHAKSTAWEHHDLPCLGWATDRLYKPFRTAELWEPYERTIACMDPSGGGDDETALAIVSVLRGMLWVKAVVGFEPGLGIDTQKVLLPMIDLLKHHAATELVIEANFGGQAIEQLVRPLLERHRVRKGEEDEKGWACSVRTITARAQKEARIIAALEPVMNAHRLVVSREALQPDDNRKRKYELQWQIAGMTREPGCLAHDDRVDALAMAVAELTPHLGYDTDTSESAAQRRARQAYIRQIEREIVGRDSGVRFFRTHPRERATARRPRKPKKRDPLI